MLVLLLGFVYIAYKKLPEASPPEPAASSFGWENLPKTLGISGEILYKNEANYQIYFSPQTNRYTIVLFGSPLKDVLQEAERGFLNLLQLPPEHACQLNVYVSTVDWFDPEESYSSFSLSFCRAASPSDVPSTPSASLTP